MFILLQKQTETEPVVFSGVKQCSVGIFTRRYANRERKHGRQSKRSRQTIEIFMRVFHR